jgi:AraC-like DNA-binding protein
MWGGEDMFTQEHEISSTEFGTSSENQPAARLSDHLHLEVCNFVAATQSLSIRTVLLAKTRILFIESGGELKLKARVGRATFILWIALKGSARFQLEKEVIMCSSGTGCVWPASTDVRLSASSDHAALVICIDRPQLELELSRLLGRPAHELEFAPWVKVDGPPNIFGALLRFIAEAIDRKSVHMSESPILATATERLLLDTLLTTQENNFSESLSALNATVVPRHLRTVMRAIRRDSARSWRLFDMAAEGNVSVRTVCDSFKRFCACTPKQFVQTVRLAHVRELLTGGPQSRSIADIARDCGFRHPGRFAATYQQVYGETPSETVRSTALNAKLKVPSRTNGPIRAFDAANSVHLTSEIAGASTEATRRFR